MGALPKHSRDPRRGCSCAELRCGIAIGTIMHPKVATVALMRVGRPDLPHKATVRIQATKGRDLRTINLM